MLNEQVLWYARVTLLSYYADNLETPMTVKALRSKFVMNYSRWAPYVDRVFKARIGDKYSKVLMAIFKKHGINTCCSEINTIEEFICCRNRVIRNLAAEQKRNREKLLIDAARKEYEAIRNLLWVNPVLSTVALVSRKNFLQDKYNF